MTMPRESLAQELARLEARHADLGREQRSLQAQIERVRSELAAAAGPSVAVAPPPRRPVSTPATPQDKVALFRNLFRGRDDVFPVLWSNARKGTKGYSPSCSNEWKPGLCEKPRVKCGQCPHQAFRPVSDQVVLDHLQGRHVLGVYPLLQDERCHLLAADFDKEGWRDDVQAFASTCRAVGVPAAVERSRSGNGAHACAGTGPSRSGIPEQADHRFRSKPIAERIGRCPASGAVTRGR